MRPVWMSARASTSSTSRPSQPWPTAPRPDHRSSRSSVLASQLPQPRRDLRFFAELLRLVISPRDELVREIGLAFHEATHVVRINVVLAVSHLLQEAGRRVEDLLWHRQRPILL